MSKRQTIDGGGRFSLYSATITAAITAVGQTAVTGLAQTKALIMEAILTVGSGGTSADVWVQTSIDGGVTWFDIANFHFTNTTASKLSVVVVNPPTAFTAGTAPGSGALAANTVLNGIIGDQIRALITTVGTFAGGTTLALNVVAKG